MRHRLLTDSRGAAFGALADPTRRAVLDLLRHGSQSAGRIAEAFPISRPAISKHLRVLRCAHLVEERREGRRRLYHLNAEPLKAVEYKQDGTGARSAAPRLLGKNPRYDRLYFSKKTDFCRIGKLG